MLLQDVPNIIVVASGKGGVGKTQMSIDISRALINRGAAVGLIDADISTPNAIWADAGADFDYSDQRLGDGQHFKPVKHDGLQMFSQSIDMPDGVALTLDGEWRAEAVADYAKNIDWDDNTQYVVIDCPPGHSAEVQTVLGGLPVDMGFIVTTGKFTSGADAQRTHDLFDDVGLEHYTILNMESIPADEIIEHALDEEEIQNVNGVGSATFESIKEKMEGYVEDFPVMADGMDMEEKVGSEIIANVPFTPDDQKRYDALDQVVNEIITITEEAEV